MTTTMITSVTMATGLLLLQLLTSAVGLIRVAVALYGMACRPCLLVMPPP